MFVLHHDHDAAAAASSKEMEMRQGGSVTRKKQNMSKKLPKNDFTRIMNEYDTFTKIA